MKKNYVSPEALCILMAQEDILTASAYVDDLNDGNVHDAGNT